MSKIIETGSDSRAKLLSGVEQLANAVVATYVSGYGSSSSDVPMSIRQAILILIGHFFENRQEVVFGSPKVMPKASEWLLEPYRIVY